MIDGIVLIAQLGTYAAIAIAFMVMCKYLAYTLAFSLILVRSLKMRYIVIVG